MYLTQVATIGSIRWLKYATASPTYGAYLSKVHTPELIN